MTKKIRILFLAASPKDFAPLRLDEEIREIDKKIQTGSWRDTYQLIPHFATRWGDLQEALLRHRPHIVHFSGHGSKTEEISVVDDQGASHAVDKQSLLELFDILKDDIRIVVLNACYSKPQAEAISEIVDYTVGMNKAIGDRAAIAFAGAFYGALSFNRSVSDAFRLGRNTLGIGKISGRDTPELSCRNGVDPTEPFLQQKETIREDYAADLKSAFEHLVAGSFEENEKELIRIALTGGRIVLQRDDTEADDQGKQLNVEVHKSVVHIKADARTMSSLQETVNPKPRGILPTLPNLVFGREESLRDVKQMMGIYETTRHDKSVTVVRGVPGVGKTTLVSVLSRDLDISKTFPDGVLWTSLYLGQPEEENANKLLSLMATWGRALGTDDILSVSSINEATARLAALLRDKQMLLIVDDVWNQAHAVPFMHAGGSRCAVLATTRVTKVAEALTARYGAVYLLPVLSEESSILLLRALAPSVVESHEEECRELVKDLEYLPLALHVAAGVLKAEAKLGLDVSDLIKGLRQGVQLVDQEAPLDRVENGTTPTLTALLQRSTERLDEQTRDCFAFLGAFAPKPATFDLDAMAAVWEMDNPKPIVRNLVGHGLLEPVGERRFQMHAILVQHARSLLTD